MELVINLKPKSIVYDGNIKDARSKVAHLYGLRGRGITIGRYCFNAYSDDKFVYAYALEKHRTKRSRNKSGGYTVTKKGCVKIFAYKIPISVLDHMGLRVHQFHRNFRLKPL